MIPLRDELPAFRALEVFARVDDLPQVPRGLPEVVVGGVEGDRGEADDVRGPKIGNDAATFERFGDAGSGVVLDGDVATAPDRVTRGADAIGIWFGRQTARFEEGDQVVGLGEGLDADALDAGLGEEAEGTEEG